MSVCVVLVPACGGESGTPPPPRDAPAKAERESVPEPDPGVKADGSIVSAVDWFEGTFDGALAKAKAEQKLVFVDVGAYWCPPCHELDEKVFTQKRVGEFLTRGYVSIHVDAEKEDGPELAERYHVQAYPTMLVLEPTGVEKGRIVDSHPASEIMAALERIAAGKNVLAELEDAVEHDPDDHDKRYELANAYALAARREQAEPLFDAVLLADPKNQAGLAAKVMYDRAMFFTYKLDGKKEDAIEAYRDLQKRFPDTPQAVRSYRQVGRILHELGRSDEAIASLEKMIASDPENVGLKSSYGWFSFREKCNPEAGLRAVDAGLKQEADNAGLYYLRAELKHLLGDNAAALESIRKASELEPKTAYYRRQVRRFEQIGAPG